MQQHVETNCKAQESSTWHKSSYSQNRGNCVEVAEGPQVLIRDTQHRHLGHLTLPAQEWQAFVHAVRRNELD